MQNDIPSSNCIIQRYRRYTDNIGFAPIGNYTCFGYFIEKLFTVVLSLYRKLTAALVFIGRSDNIVLSIEY